MPCDAISESDAGALRVSDLAAARALAKCLKRMGYHVVAVSTAQEARDILHSETPNVILAAAEGQDISGKDLWRHCEDLRPLAATFP